MLKDVFDTADMPTTGGYLPLKGVKPTKDAFIVKRLREAGAVILGKLNQSDWYAELPTLGANAHRRAHKEPVRSRPDTRLVQRWHRSRDRRTLRYRGHWQRKGFSVRTPTSDSNLFGLTATSALISRDGQMWSHITGERAGPMGRSVYDVALSSTRSRDSTTTISGPLRVSAECPTGRIPRLSTEMV